MANGFANANADGNDSVETVVSSIRPGMKREFSMMLKSQGEFPIEMGQRRTRSQNSASNNKVAAKNGGGGYNEKRNNKRLKGSSAKNMKKEVENRAVDGEQAVDGEEAKVGQLAGVEGLKDNGAGYDGEKVVLVSEEEEPKSDVVDGSSDDEMKGNMVEEGMAEGEEKGMLESEKQGSEMEFKSDLVKNASDMEIDVEKVVGGGCGTEAMAEEPKDGVVEGTNEDLQIRKEVSVQMESGFETNNAAVEVSDLSDKVGVSTALFDEGRRFTRSLLKPSVEASEHSVTEDIKYDAISPAHTSSKMEMKMSKKVELKKTPTRLRELLDTGLLEGLKVQYIRGARARASGETGFPGVIRGSGILCFCKNCKGIKVVSPNTFESHTGSMNKRPPEYIYLENGKTLRDVLNACKIAPSDSLELAIRQAIGCTDTGGAKHPVDSKGASDSVEYVHCPNSKGNELSSSHLDDTSTSNIRYPMKSIPSSNSRSNVQGRLTRKDLRLHKLIFESDILPDGTELGYFAGAKRILTGHKSGQGIYCDCCHNVVSPSTFEDHAGYGSRRKPYLHIFISNGVSLHELSIEIKKTMITSTDESDDVCSICKNRGELLCCDQCPRAFHKGCIGLQRVPQGKWYCRQCEPMIERGKHAERNVNAVAAGRVAGVDPFEEIKKRCIRILDTIDNDDGGCVLCRRRDFAEPESGFGPLTVMICDQCENEYHVGCLKEHGMDDLKELPDGKWFCRSECRSIHSALQKLVADGERRLPDSVLDVIRKKCEETGSEEGFDLNITWRLLHGKTASEEDRKWLSNAVSVFHERFDPIAVNSTQDDLIPYMINGRGNKDQDFGGIYCAVLVVKSMVVSAGIFRVFGQEVAEIPLVATSIGCQGKGYFGSLFCCIENFLASLNVRNLVLPAAPEAKAIWMNKFGFVKITDKKLKEYRKDYPIMVFQGTTILHKPVCKP